MRERTVNQDDLRSDPAKWVKNERFERAEDERKVLAVLARHPDLGAQLRKRDPQHSGTDFLSWLAKQANISVFAAQRALKVAGLANVLLGSDVLPADSTLRSVGTTETMLEAYAVRPYVQRINRGGNFCNHDPAWPALDLVKPRAKKFPPILKKLIQRIEWYYDNPVQWMPSVNYANGSTRKQRSERREAITKFLAAVLHNMDLASMRCGMATPLGFKVPSLSELAGYADISFSRASRAKKDLRYGGIITTHQKRYEDAQGGLKAYYDVITVNPALFGLFEIKQWEVKAARDYATKKLNDKVKRWKNKRPRLTTRDTQRINVKLRAVSNQLGSPKPRKRDNAPITSTDPPKAPTARQEQLKMLQALLAEDANRTPKQQLVEYRRRVDALKK